MISKSFNTRITEGMGFFSPRFVQTIKYLGINLDDQADAFDLVSQYEKALSAPQRGIFAPKPVTCSGPKEI